MQRSGVGNPLVAELPGYVSRDSPAVFSAPNRRSCGMKLSAERIAGAIFTMIRFGVGISRGPNMLEIVSGQRRFIRREGVSELGSALTGGEDNKGDNRERGGREKRSFPVPQMNRRQLLTVIHNPASAFC